jgi:hypothetical protein
MALVFSKHAIALSIWSLIIITRLHRDRSVHPTLFSVESYQGEGANKKGVDNFHAIVSTVH